MPPEKHALPLRLSRLFLPAFAALMLLASCAADGLKRPEYPEVLSRWTRSTKVYEGLETRLYMTATYKNRDFRYSYIDRYVDTYMLSEGYRRSMRERELEQSEHHNEFFFSAYTPDDSWNDFARPDSVWKLYLEDNLGNRLAPLSIRKVDTRDSLLREFFPYVDLWSTGYIVQFPKYSESGEEPVPGVSTEFIRLVVVGVLGRGELEWRFEKE